jgi:Domain of unknown function (DUF6797)
MNPGPVIRTRRANLKPALLIFSALLAFLGVYENARAQATNRSARAPWADFVEPDFPFFSSVLDARKLGPDWPADNLTPRGLVLNLGQGAWACFDTDLLRMAGLWSGSGVTPVSMSQGSYHLAGLKAPPGQGKLPRIAGKPWLANGIYPGWQLGDSISLADPREPGPDPKEVGRGPVDPKLGRFQGIRLTRTGLILEYRVGGTSVREKVEARLEKERLVIQRGFHLGPVEQPLWLILGRRSSSASPQAPLNWKLSAEQSNGHTPVEKLERSDGLLSVRVHPSPDPVEFEVAFSADGPARTWAWGQRQGRDAPKPPAVRWPQTVTTSGMLGAESNAYVVDNIAIPRHNPWRRNVRLADLAFFPDGRAAAVTFDGDVWMIDGLGGDLGGIRWRRFASGLHEPLGLCLRNGELFVNDRNGIWRLRDTDGNGEADLHELFSNAFGQTAETREFATGIRAAPDGAFIISKGGQQSSTLGKHNGTVLRIAPDGRSSEVLGWGLRMPFIGVHPRTGLVTASDQQGNYIPSTPLHIIRDHLYYGFLTGLEASPTDPAPIADPLTWIPHPVNASGVSQVWLTEARMGPLNEALIHLAYFRPEIFLVRLNDRTSRMQAAVLSLTRNLEFPLLNGAVNPRDGQLYVIGFQIWGTEARQISGLARLRYTGAPSTLPREVVPMDKGILLRFDLALDTRTASNPANFFAERWNYRRTANYGSPHYKLDGSKGQETMAPSSAYVSRDGRSIFVGIPDLKPVMQMRLGWALALS